MLKPKTKLSKLVIVGVTTHTMCFNCYCHHQNGAIIPYQRLAKRRKAIRYRSRDVLPFKYRFETIASNTTQTHQIVGRVEKKCWFYAVLWTFTDSLSLSFFFFIYFLRRKSGDSSGSRQIRNTPDWSDNAVAGDHLWVSTSVSGDCCYVGDNDCTVSSFTLWPSLFIYFNGNLFF